MPGKAIKKSDTEERLTLVKMRINHRDLYCIILCIFIPAICQANEKRIIGWVENVKVMSADIEFSAKLDTGALTSSINAMDIEEFEKEDETWVRFKIVNNDNESKIVELPQERIVKIKRHVGKSQKRHVVKMGLCLGNMYKETQVSLVNRERFVYKLLIGRRFLKDNFVIDPSQHHITTPDCEKEESDQ